MDLPVMPPVSPMLAKPVPAIPPGRFYEPKWDGFRAIVFRDGDEVEIGSRNERPMTRYFPEVADAVRAHLPERCVLDGEIVIAGDGRLDFWALQQRLHPAASRVELLAGQTPASFIAFDLLALDDTDYTGRPFRERRAALERALAGAAPPIHLTPITTDEALAARWFETFEGAGLDGLIAKDGETTYQPNKRVMAKVKHVRTADCVLAGYRVHKSGPDAVGSLLLGLYDDGSSPAPPVGGHVRRAHVGRGRRRVLRGTPARAVRGAAAARLRARRPSVGRAGGDRVRAARRGQPLEPGEEPLVRPAAARAGPRGALRPHGGRALPASAAVRALAPGSRPALVRVRPARAPRPLRPEGHSWGVNPERRP